MSLRYQSMTPDLMMPLEDHLCPPKHTLSVTKPVKKRKSWGQELPEPKTSLPPRKRAKTDDEKEQRRIERIKRNRTAAHNSRERKRVEAEHLADVNEKLQEQIKMMRALCADQTALLARYEEQFGTLPRISSKDTSEYESSGFAELSIASSLASTSPASSFVDPRASLAYSTPGTTPETSPFVKMEDSMPGMTGQDDGVAINVVRPAVSVQRGVHSQTIASVNIPDIGAIDTPAFTFTEPLSAITNDNNDDYLQDGTLDLVEPFMSGEVADQLGDTTALPVVDNFDTWFDFDAPQDSMVDFTLHDEPTA